MLISSTEEESTYDESRVVFVNGVLQYCILLIVFRILPREIATLYGRTIILLMDGEGVGQFPPKKVRHRKNC